MTDVARDSSPTTRGAIEIRRATVDDLSTVVELRLALLREYTDHPVYGRLRRDAEDIAPGLFEQQIVAPDQAIFLAARAGVVAGILRCADAKGSPLLVPDRYCYITSVYVKPEHRRHGVLAGLLEHAETWARQRGLTEMRLHNSTRSEFARAAWDRLGFEVNEELRLKHIGR